ncbi:MAG: 3-deoxy-D-manno-octulosonic acid transferase [Alistipes sp.]|nr:3-deoxy-D-manno-octulosonic acid transferase [Candidatus Minthomonas equi]
MQIFYHIGLFLYFLAARIVSIFNQKARFFVDGRKNLYDEVSATYHPDKPVVWFHCSSVGEFEQARPLIERIKRDKMDCQILLTFYSPSGYELRKNYEYADWVYYLPLDTIKNARRFVSMINPSRVIFIKYEFWMNFLNELKRRHIPTYVACAIFRPGQIFFRWYGNVMRKTLRCFDRLFVQNEASEKLLSTIGICNVDVFGDTRFDRVYEILRSRQEGDDTVSSFSADSTTIVAGSTWENDEVILAEAFRPFADSAKLVLVPHETDERHICKIEKLFSEYGTVRYSVLSSIGDGPAKAERMAGAQVLIIDTVGILSVVYRYAGFSYVGGGFTKSGIHNILESATYGVPVIFGPIYEKFREACDLIALGGAVSVSNASELEQAISQWMSLPSDNEPSACRKAADICSRCVSENLGATDKILKAVFPTPF